MKFRLVFWALIVLSWATASGQPQDSVRLAFDHITSEDGLSQGTGYAIMQDHQGYMWIGTRDGLNKFNGYEMTVYRPQQGDSTSISSGHVVEIYEDKRNNVWVGTQSRGVNLYDRDTDTFRRFVGHSDRPDEGPSSNTIVAILEDSRGNLWIGGQPGLNIYDRDEDEFRYFHEAEGLSSDHITALHECSRGYLWVGTDEGLNRFNHESETFEHYLPDPEDPHSLSHGMVTEIYEDHDGTLWVGTEGSGLHRFDPESEQFSNYRHDPDDPQSISGDIILSMVEDHRGRFWVGTENEGLNLMNRQQGTFQRFQSDASNPNSLTHDSVWELYESRDHILWVGTFTGGLNLLDRKETAFEHYRHERHADQALSNDYVLAFLEDSHGNFYVGTDGGGLNMFNRQSGRFTTIEYDPETPENLLSSNVVLSLHEDTEGYVWIGHYGGGITRYDPVTGDYEKYRHDPEDSNSLANDHVYVIYEDSEERIWFGTNGAGINRYDAENDQFIRLGPQGDGTGFVRAIYEDSRGHFWIGSHGGGIRQINPETHEVKRHFYEGMNGLSSNQVLAIHEDNRGRLWVGVSEGNLHRLDYDSYTFESYSTDDGLPSSVINGIRSDEDGNLWLSTNNGISRFNPDSETFTNFGVENGLQGREFLKLSHYRDRQGYIYFGGTNGFNRFHPDNVEVDGQVSPVAFTDLKIYNQSVPIGGDSPLQKHISQAERIELPYDASVITFEYVALDFNPHKNNEFAYKLAGFDDEWQNVGDRRSATYTNLSPGSYTFQVRAANNFGVWGAEVASIDVEIIPPFWQTAWFYLLAFMITAGAIFGGYRMRVKAIYQRNKYLVEKINERTSELSERNDELQKTMEDLKQTRGELIEKAHKAGMADLAAGVLHNVGNVLNSVNTSVSIMDETLRQSKVRNLKRANNMLRENMDNLEHFILNNPKGKQLLNYYLSLEQPFEEEMETLANQNERLTKKVKLIADIISTQQNVVTAGRVTEQMALEEFVEEILTLQAGTHERHNIQINRDFRDVEKIDAERSKLAHVLINLLKNAKESMDHLPPEQKETTISTSQDDEYVYLSVSDTGSGISTEKLHQVFQHGFTTKEEGNGFGLHSSVNYMQEMGGNIEAKSEGTNRGATFVLSFVRKSTRGQYTLQNGVPETDEMITNNA